MAPSCSFGWQSNWEVPVSFRDFVRVQDPPEDPMDKHALHLARSQRGRDYFVAVEEVKMMQEMLNLCYMRAGVNQMVDCKDLSLAYIAKTRSRNYGAYDPSGIKNHMKNKQPYAGSEEVPKAFQ
ncbi:hypothetical protein T492DRAFT_929068 [Pavlovales sp. CCMP2436]|nr:hypothetical protein T492DRAFT_929068 [Pavlovales sp. CCMP2436]|mmetsp:Transcript_14154/g.35982  ORF Transcript_14154/g.35982 Transcript_14154/m.35982 type:complete len:124 (+) Transcript_14154:64-435(+)|eukprot:CAMPEP_0179854940 /NCGR_PEP_ID=MMETSP0982-20121206/10239_1 /TAXON_ID=483367 /ORGANISM="non described non described, Strain CCMP 2436" /LENGTH=123 /DNA_ID=CAMNT_0021740935 /DNA_START=85 /DNA_END=456 /DNA_ORIENTATION=-